MRKEIINIVEEYLPLYDSCPEGGHGKDHIINVIKEAYLLANKLHKNSEIAVVAALFHDIGLLTHPRETHHIGSGEFIISHKNRLSDLFSQEEIDLIYYAVIEHRASYKGAYSSIYSKIVSDADRSIDIDTMIKRSYSYNKKKNSYYNEEDLYKEVFNFLSSKYGKGNIKLNLPYSEDRLKASQKILNNEKLFRKKYNELIK